MSEEIIRKCCIPGCPSNTHQSTLFPSPKSDKIVLDKWSEILKIKNFDIDDILICEKHFDPSHITTGSDGSKQLVSVAVPTVFEIDPSLCRFCLNVIEDVDKVPIDFSLKSSFHVLMGEMLKESEVLPDTCCNRCSTEIAESAAVRRKIIENQENLQKLLELKFPKNFINLTDDYSLKPEKHLIKEEFNTPEFDFEDLSFNRNDEYNSNFNRLEVKTELTEEFDAFLNFKSDAGGYPIYDSFEMKTKKHRKTRKFPDNLDDRKKKSRITKPIPERVKCNECGTKVSKFNFTIHFLKKHKLIEHFECDLCGIKKIQKSTLVDHMQTNHMLVESRIRYNCTMCEKTYLNQYTLEEHVKHKHLKHVDRICEICGISIPSRFRYNDHMRSKHTLEKPYSCNECCNFECSTSAMLREHKIRFHPKGTSVCNICFKTFSTVKKLHNHKRLHKEKNFACDFENCDKKFRNAHKLKVHKECHLGVKKFQCDFCSAPFQQRNHVNRHITSVHLKPEYKCEVPGCNSKYARKDFLRSHVRSHHSNVGEENLKALLERIRNMKDVEIDQTIYTISRIQ